MVVLVLAALALSRVWPPARAWVDALAPELARVLGAADAPPTADEPRWSCRVLHVIDGDTLDVVCDGRRERVRLLRVDTPEREEPGYEEARRALLARVDRGPVELVFERPGEPTRGDHGRLLAYVFKGDENVNLELVREGWSPFFDRYGRGRFARAFEAAEREARRERRGLWALGARR